jgi:phage terminase Nu1 subunit (DNA packaging protein)
MTQKKQARQRRLVTRREMSELLDVHMATITAWERSGLPIEVRGRRGIPSQYDMAAVLDWHVRRARPAGQAGEAVCGATEKALLDRRKREEIELKLRLRAGELVEVAAVQAEFVDIATRVKSRLRALPSSIAEQLVSAAASGPAVVKTMLLSHVDQVLRELAREGTAEPGAPTE